MADTDSIDPLVAGINRLRAERDRADRAAEDAKRCYDDLRAKLANANRALSIMQNHEIRAEDLAAQVEAVRALHRETGAITSDFDDDAFAFWQAIGRAVRPTAALSGQETDRG